METELRARLLANATIAGLVGTRIDWDDRPQGKPLPAITLMLVSDPRPQHMEGFQVTRESWVQADLWATDKAQVRTLREAVISTLAPAAVQGAQTFLRSFPDVGPITAEKTETGLVIRCQIDFHINHVSP